LLGYLIHHYIPYVILVAWLPHLNLANPIPYFDSTVTNRYGAVAALFLLEAQL